MGALAGLNLIFSKFSEVYFNIIKNHKSGKSSFSCPFLADLSRWSVARAFSPGRFLNLILAHRGEINVLNEARH